MDKRKLQKITKLYLRRVNVVLRLLGLDYIDDNIGQIFDKTKNYKINKQYQKRLYQELGKFFESFASFLQNEVDAVAANVARDWRYGNSVNIGYIVDSALEELYIGLQAQQNVFSVSNYIDEVITSSAAQASQYAAIAQDIANGSLIQSKHKSALKQLLEAHNEEKMTVINGKRYKTEKYAETLARTTNITANSETNLIIAENNDTDLVRISDHNTKTPFDAQFEGRIFSIKGKDKRFPLLLYKPPYHPNCLHIMQPVFVEFYSPQDLEKEIENSNREFDSDLLKNNASEYNTTDAFYDSKYSKGKQPLKNTKAFLTKKLLTGQALTRSERRQYDQHKINEIKKYREREIRRQNRKS